MLTDRPPPSRLRQAVLALLLLIAAPAAPAPALPTAMSGRIDALFGAWDRTDTPGCAVGVYRDGGIVHARGYGMANLELSVPITPRTLFDIGSNAKQFTALALLLLEAEGELSLADDLRRHLPELPEWAQAVSLHQLLAHTAGVRDYIGLLALAGADVGVVSTAREALDMLARQQALNFPPGQRHLYSNSGYFLAAEVVARRSGDPFPAFMRGRVFRPLGMTATRFRDDHREPVPQRADAYAPAGDGYRTDLSNWEQVGSGALYSSVADLARWVGNFREPRLGDAQLLARLQTPLALASGEKLRYAMGLEIEDYRGVRLLGHGGDWTGYRSELLRVPEAGLGVAVLCNLSSIDAPQLARRIVDIVLAERLQPRRAPRESAVAPARLRRLAGVYVDPHRREFRRFVFDQRRLWLDDFGSRLALLADGRHRFVVADELPVRSFRFDRGEAGDRIVVEAVGGSERRYRRAELPASEPARLQLLAGRYRSDELGAEFVLERIGEALVLLRPRRPPTPLQPLAVDWFRGGGAGFRFTRDGDGDGAVTGFVLDFGRVRGLLFERLDPGRCQR